MVLNKIPTFDKGYVGVVWSAPSDLVLQDIFKTLRPDSSLNFRRLATLALLIKCPLFVLLNFHKYGIATYIAQFDELEAYVPDESEIGTEDAGANKIIADHLMVTTQSLLLSIKGLMMDKCDPNAAQCIAPVSTYATVLAYASLDKWDEYCGQLGLPHQVESYRSAVESIIKVEWPKAWRTDVKGNNDEDKDEEKRDPTPEKT